jgi:hypothetical protein
MGGGRGEGRGSEKGIFRNRSIMFKNTDKLLYIIFKR